MRRKIVKQIKSYIIIISFSILLLAELILFISHVKLRQTIASQYGTMALYRDQYSSLYNFSIRNIQLNNDISCIEEDITAISQYYPSDYYIFCPENLCSSCLLSLIDTIRERGMTINEVLFVLESDSRFLVDEIRANGFAHVIFSNVFDSIGDDGKIVVAKLVNRQYRYFYFDTKVDVSLLHYFLTNNL